jgi:hypothetical protein
MAEFIDCVSLNISFNVMGIATVSYTIVHDGSSFVTYDSISAGGKTFTGYVVNASMDQILNTSGWFETHVTLVATTN